MIEQYNPFKENRAEQMKDLWKYYVPFPGLDGDGKPLVVEGGRGSGKTMFFQCNSWRQNLLKIRKDEDPVTYLLDKKEFIGLYYRVDTTFVSSMRGKEESNWSAIFETYLSICILKEIIDLIIELNKGMLIDEKGLSTFAQCFSRKLCPNRVIDSIIDLNKEIDVYLDIIEDKINGTSVDSTVKLRYVNAHRFISEACKECSSLLHRDSLLYKVFIDEYETLQDYQQKIVNTLIKHSTLPVVFNIGMKPKGMKTSETISQTETIEAPHDYELLPLGFDEEKYPDIVRDICKKRIQLGKEKGKIPQNASENIEEYLGKYSLEYELSKIAQTKVNLNYKVKLKKLIIELAEQEGIESHFAQEYCRVLCDEAPLLNSRLHYALLCKKTYYTPSVKELYEAYTNLSSRYNDWMHNRKNGVVFLLCKEAKKEKMYFGFDAFTALSSNIVRYFLELCEHTFKLAFLDGYVWGEPISPEKQSEAAQYVSEYKVLDIAGYEPYGRELRIFTQYLGQMFYRLHTGEDNSLGEPEPNHFNTKDLSISDRIRKLISSSIMWTVLQEGEATKRKQSKLSPETVDYYLNKIYVPYFGISYRNQRKITIDEEILEDLFSGDEQKAKKGLDKYFKCHDSVSPDQMTLFET